MKIERSVWIFVGVVTLLRWALLSTTDLQFDEAHYWMWSERLAPAYYSKGPGVAFAIRASTAVFGPSEFGVRFFSPLLSAATSLLLFYLARRLFDARAGVWAVIGANATPIFNLGSFLMTIDPLSLFFWVAAMFSFWRVVESSPRFSWYWLATGVFVGLGFLCKYTNAFAIAGIVLVLALMPKLRVEFRRPGFYLMLLIFVACCVPAVVWNQQHAWATLTHLRSRGGMDRHFGIHPVEFVAFLGEHFLAYSPLICLAIAIAVIGSWRRALQQPRRLFLLWFGLPVLVFYALLSFNKAAAPNWDALAFPGFGLLAIAFWRERVETRRSWQIAAGCTVALGILTSMPALNSDILRSFGVNVSRRDPADGMRGWRSATMALEELRAQLETAAGEKFFLIADQRDRASEISFYLRDKRITAPGHPACYLVESQAIENQFSFWPRYDEFVGQASIASTPADQTYTEEKGVNLFTGQSALFVQDAGHKNPPHNIRAAFASAERVANIAVRRFGKVVRNWDVYLCRNYRTLPL